MTPTTAAGTTPTAASKPSGGTATGQIKASLSSTTGNGIQIDKALIDMYQKQTGATVQLIEAPQSSTDRLAQYLQFFSAQAGDIDVYQIDVIWPGIVAEHMVDLNKYFTKDDLANYFAAIVKNNTVDGKLVGIPYFTDAGILFYRKDLLQKYNFAKPPETWDDLEKQAKTIQDGERKDNQSFWGFVWQGAAYEGLTCDGLEWQVSHGGGTIINQDTKKVEVNNPQAIQAFTMAKNWINNITPPGVTNYKEEDARGVWQAGNAAFMRNWPYAYASGQAADSKIKDKFDVVQLPTGGSRHADCLGGWQLAVTKYSKNQDAAGQFVKFMASKDTQKYRAIQGAYLPTIGTLYKDPDVLKANPFYERLFDVFSGGAVARPSTVSGDQYNQVSTAYFKGLNSILSGGQDPAAGAAAIEKEIQTIMR